jgi:hypothetical protein
MFDSVRFSGLPMPRHCDTDLPEGQTKSLDCNLGMLEVDNGLLTANPGYNGYVAPGGFLPWTGTMDYRAVCPKCNAYVSFGFNFSEGDILSTEIPREWDDDKTKWHPNG